MLNNEEETQPPSIIEPPSIIRESRTNTWENKLNAISTTASTTMQSSNIFEAEQNINEHQFSSTVESIIETQEIS